MPNYDFQKDKFHVFFSNGDDLAYLDRESLSALSTVLSRHSMPMKWRCPLM